MRDLWDLAAWFMLGSSLGCAVADLRYRRWRDLGVDVLAAGLCVAAGAWGE